MAGGMAVLKKWCLMMVLLLPLFCPSAAGAAEVNLGLRFSGNDEGVACSEFVWNGRVIWRVTILCEGVKTVMRADGQEGLVVIPDMSGGMFKLKMYVQ